MKKIGIYYGSTTGTCEDLANRIASKLGVDSSNVASVSELNESAQDYDVLILGTSTWGDGELQDDWFDAIETLKGLNLAGKEVVIFGCGDSGSYGDTFCSAMKPIYDAAKAAGANVVKGAPTSEYTFGNSDAVIGDTFVGFPFDEVNEADKTDDRIEKLCASV